MNWCTEYPDQTFFPFNDGFFTRFNWDLSSVYIFTCSNARRIHGDATFSAITDGRSRYFRATLRYLIPTCLELFALLLNRSFVTFDLMAHITMFMHLTHWVWRQSISVCHEVRIHKHHVDK